MECLLYRCTTKKKIPKSTKVENFKGLWSHVQTIATHMDSVKSYFPEYFKSHVEMSQKNAQYSDLLDDNNGGNFYVETGLWNFPSFTKFKPKDIMHPQLIQYTKKRIITELEEEHAGIELKPDAYKNNTLRMCDCSAGYSLETEYTPKGHSTLYTRMGPVRCSVFNLSCHNRTCDLKFEEVAEEQGICFISKGICVGDEIGWDFVQDVGTKRTSFKAYCEDMTRKYQANNPMSASFMSINTFPKWLFGWMSNMKLDFRKEIDPVCGYHPKILTCDGTHIGVSIKHLHLDKPITQSDIDKVNKPSIRELKESYSDPKCRNKCSISAMILWEPIHKKKLHIFLTQIKQGLTCRTSSRQNVQNQLRILYRLYLTAVKMMNC